MIEGLIGKKIGMTHLFAAEARVIPVTVLEVGPCVVTQVRTEERDGYEAVQVGYGAAKQLNKPSGGHLAASGARVRHLREFDADDVSSYKVGQELSVSQFQPDDFVDVVSTTKGRGFQGAMRRHGFGGGQKTHGQGDRGRAVGSIGAGTYPGRVLKGKKMPGHMGNKRKTVRKLKVVSVDAERNLLFVRGAVPGSRNTTVMVRYAHGVPVAERVVPEEPVVEIEETVTEEAVAEVEAPVTEETAANAAEPVAEEAVAEEPAAEVSQDEPAAEVEEAAAEEPATEASQDEPVAEVEEAAADEPAAEVSQDEPAAEVEEAAAEEPAAEASQDEPAAEVEEAAAEEPAAEASQDEPAAEVEESAAEPEEASSDEPAAEAEASSADEAETDGSEQSNGEEERS